jgi:hypothetical protein
MSLRLLQGVSTLLCLALGASRAALADAPISSPDIVFSPYNWYREGSEYAQTANPGAYLKVGFTGTKIGVEMDVSPLILATVPASHYPIVRYSVDGGPPKTVQLGPSTSLIPCAEGLRPGNHTLLLQYVAGYVFLDFWTPVNVLRITGLSLDPSAKLLAPFGPAFKQRLNALFFGDSITNGDDDVATFADGITNEVNTQDATIAYPSVVASAIGAEYGVIAYGGASWDGIAADGHTPGLMRTYGLVDAVHSRLVGGKLFPVPDDIFINMGENSGPSGHDVPNLLTALRAASGHETNIFVIIPFSGRARAPLTSGFAAYRETARSDNRTYLIDLGDDPCLSFGAPTMWSVDGQHPLAPLHALLGAQLLHARAQKVHVH